MRPGGYGGYKPLAAKLDAALGSPSGSYTIVLDGTETDLGSFAPKTLNVTGDKNITITIRGNGKTVQLGSNGGLFTVGAATGSNLKLAVQDLTLRGRSNNNASVVRVESGGTLEMKAGSRITGNTSFADYGGGVYVDNGIFTMSGGAVSGNIFTTTVYYVFGGGRVFVNGTFSMSGGAVSGNSAPNSGRSGVYINDGGIFTMSGGAVSGNSAIADNGGVYIDGGTFNMSGGEVTGNFCSSGHGGGVYIYDDGTFNMSGGKVTGNSASMYGGGVYVNSHGIFTMNGGVVSSNSASMGGGGVNVAGGTFSMSGGEVTGNILSGTNGYGREVSIVATFKMSGDARPERVFLVNDYNDSMRIIISGPLSGGIVPIDLRITSSFPLTSWAGRQILQLDESYGGGNLASLKAHFTLGNSRRTDSPYTEAAITGYKIDDGGYFVTE